MNDSWLNVPIDVSVFEKTKKAYVIPLDCGWDDVGSWESLWKMSKKDQNGNYSVGWTAQIIEKLQSF